MNTDKTQPTSKKQGSGAGFLAYLASAACVLIVAATMCWAGDAPWGGDDVSLVTAAVKANAEHRLVPAGLGGSFGYPYGPIPSQIYQLLAMLSHNPIVLVRLHAVLFAGLTAISLLYLATVLNLSLWFAPFTMVGPFFWFYTRLMWDNTFAIPLGTLLLAAYGDYQNRPSARAFFIAVSCAVGLPLIHPMTLPLVLAVAGHGIWAHYRAFKKHWRGLIVIAVCAGVLNWRYAFRIAEQLGHARGLIDPRGDALSRASATLFPLFCGRLFSAEGFFDQRGPELGWEQNPAIALLRQFTLIAYPLIWLGILMAIRRLPRGITLPAICLGALLLQSLMDAWLKISPYPHYYCGTWAAAVIFLWTGIDALKSIRLRIPIACAYGVCLLIATIAFAVDIHYQEGGNVWYGPSLAKQLGTNTEIRAK